MNDFLLNVTEQDISTRLDVFISNKIKTYSRSYIKKLINDGMVNVNNVIRQPNYRLKSGEQVKVFIPKTVKVDIKPENIKIDIIYEDNYIMIINKPQGMVVHPAHGNYSGTLVNALLYQCTSLSGINGIIRPGIVHRLDKDTSGLLVVAKTNVAHIELSNQFKEGSTIRKYVALLEGKMKSETGVVKAPIGRHPVDRKKMMVTSKNSKYAETKYKILESFKNNTLVEAKLETGRTHQIRVHMSYIGHPVVGDILYGYKKNRFNLKGQLLHASILGLNHPITKKDLKFRAPLPDYFVKVLGSLRCQL
ncbi:MAG: RluA family pseudouridine synthase [Firmicutes bacterium]|nr:RluA family pseudouridine synthase [Bacillota bacterium]